MDITQITCTTSTTTRAAATVFHLNEILRDTHTSGTSSNNSILVWAANANPAAARAPFPAAKPHIPSTAMSAAGISVPGDAEKQKQTGVAPNTIAAISACL